MSKGEEIIQTGTIKKNALEIKYHIVGKSVFSVASSVCKRCGSPIKEAALTES